MGGAASEERFAPPIHRRPAKSTLAKYMEDCQDDRRTKGEAEVLMGGGKKRVQGRGAQESKRDASRPYSFGSRRAGIGWSSQVAVKICPTSVKKIIRAGLTGRVVQRNRSGVRKPKKSYAKGVGGKSYPGAGWMRMSYHGRMGERCRDGLREPAWLCPSDARLFGSDLAPVNRGKITPSLYPHHEALDELITGGMHEERLVRRCTRVNKALTQSHLPAVWRGDTTDRRLLGELYVRVREATDDLSPFPTSRASCRLPQCPETG